jgi:hypothetical protein
VGITGVHLEGRGIVFADEPRDLGFGIAATVVLPGDVRVTLYEPRHRTAI